jgi:biopolymer transport protein ExbD
MALASASRRRKAEPMVALVNIVFLLLVFFLAAAALAPPLDGRVRLAEAADLVASPPPDALVLLPDGRMLYRGAETTPEGFLAARREGDEATVARIVPDRALPARDLVAIAVALREAGAGEVRIVTERGLE